VDEMLANGERVDAIREKRKEDEKSLFSRAHARPPPGPLKNRKKMARIGKSK
jgi:hypothetical protein